MVYVVIMHDNEGTFTFICNYQTGAIITYQVNYVHLGCSQFSLWFPFNCCWKCRSNGVIDLFNPYNTDVDYSNITVILLALIWRVLESEICLKIPSPDIRFVINFTKPNNFQSF